MMSNNHGKMILAVSLPMIILITIAGYCGLFLPDTYSKETAHWYAQAVGQDTLNLILLLPFLFITSLLAWKKNKIAMRLWGGGVFFLIYTYTIYCFTVHFNRLFLVYCMILGLSFYSFLSVLLMQAYESSGKWYSDKCPVKPIGIYFIGISSLFFFLWLSEIIPAIIGDTIPENTSKIGAFTNPVHVLDLSICLPGLLITAYLLLRRKPLAFFMAPVLMTFCILMELNIGGLILIMRTHGIDADLSIVTIMGLLAFLGIVLLILFFKGAEPTHD